VIVSPSAPAQGQTPAPPEQVRELFHRLNNQLGIILAHAELLEAKSADEVNRARATQLVTSALDAMATAKSIRQLTEPELAGS
jgi:two-component sensor histidine kinase